MTAYAGMGHVSLRPNRGAVASDLGSWGVFGPLVRRRSLVSRQGFVAEHSAEDQAAATRTPSPVIIVCATVVVVVLVAGVVGLVALGKDTTALSGLVNTLLNGATVLVGGGAAVYAGKAYSASATSAKRLNGELDARLVQAAHQALDERGAPPRQVSGSPVAQALSPLTVQSGQLPPPSTSDGPQ